jgi:putative FmdB family regulatory protein
LPLYEYECPKDGTFEKIQKFSDPPLTKCPTCGGPVERLLSAPAIQFKGTGWYITDYARKGDSGGGKKDGAKSGGGSSESSKDTGSASSSSDSKAGSSKGSSGSDKK